MFFGVVMVTMDPRQGVEVIRLVKPKTAIPIHYDDYNAFQWALGDTGQPPDDPHGWWRAGTQTSWFEEFSASAKYATPGHRGASSGGARRTPSPRIERCIPRYRAPA